MYKITIIDNGGNLYAEIETDPPYVQINNHHHLRNGYSGIVVKIEKLMIATNENTFKVEDL